MYDDIMNKDYTHQDFNHFHAAIYVQSELLETCKQ